MGTRHLTVVVSNEQVKVAQYGQWDGYPSGAGETISAFIRERMDFDKFKANVEATTWSTAEESKKIDEDKNWPEKYPWLSRDCGSKILEYVQEAPRKLSNMYEFAADSLFCEWAWVVNLDNKTLEVYRGFNKKPVEPTQRFAEIPFDKRHDGTYFHVRFVKAIPFADLTKSTMEDLESEMYPDEDEEDED